MTEESFVVELGGRRWALPHLPFRIIKSVQPELLRVYAETTEAGAATLTESQIDGLATAAWRAITHVDPKLSYEDFVALPFSIADLFAALPAVAQAAGLRVQAATAEASPDAGKSISTP
jgi:hypothetical protein